MADAQDIRNEDGEGPEEMDAAERKTPRMPGDDTPPTDAPPSEQPQKQGGDAGNAPRPVSN